MNCRDVKKLIPLYTGGELNPAEVARVRRHIESCGRCHDLAAEFTESLAWLRELDTPEFDEEDFDNLRAAVREEIARVQSGSSLFDLLAPVWNRRAGIAASAALMLLSAGLLVYSNRQKSPEGHIAQAPEVVKERNDVNGIETDDQSQRRKPAAPHRSHRRKAAAKLPLARIIALNNQIREEMPSHSEITKDHDLRDTNEGSEREMLRIEIQTADPNIRIIWFVPADNRTMHP